MGCHSFRTLQWNDLVIYWRVVDRGSPRSLNFSEFCCQCLPISASGGCESHVCLWRISTLQPVVMHWAEDFQRSQIGLWNGTFASDFLLSDPPLWCIAGCMLVYTFWQVQPILARREWTRESTSEEMERPEFRCVITWRLNVYLSELSRPPERVYV